MNCKLCNKSVVKEGLCRSHYIAEKEKVYLDNTDIDNLGIVKWLRDFLPEHYRNTFPEEHKIIYQTFLRLYDPIYKNKIQRYREVIAFRGFAKSKIVMGLIAYAVSHNNSDVTIKRENGDTITCRIKESFMVIASETGGMAETFVTNIRTEFAGNERLKYFYKMMIEDAQDSLDKEWTKRAFKINGIYVLGVGQGMQIRGRVKGAYRITSMFFDDVYSENNVITEESRRKIKNWFDNAALNSVDDLDGKVLLVGTIVHEDTVIVECRANKLWKHIEIPVMPLDKFNKFIKEHIKINQNTGEVFLPYDEAENEIEKIGKQEKYFKDLETESDWQLTWKDRAGLYFLALKYQEAVIKNQLNGLYQEYFHITIPTDSRRFKREQFQLLKATEYKVYHKYGYNWFECSRLYNKPQMINISFGIDTASGQLDGDDSVISIVGALPDRRLIMFDDIGGKFGMRDVINEDSYENLRYNKIVTNTDYIAKKGYVDEAFRLALKWRPYRINCGIAGREIEYVNVMRKLFIDNNLYDIQINVRPQTVRDGKKEERIFNTLTPYYSTMMVFHVEQLEKKEHQLEFLGKTKNDDYADATECGVKGIQFPINVSIDMFENPKKISKFATVKVENYDWRVN